MGKVKDSVKGLASDLLDPDFMSDVAFLGFGSLVLTASLATLPGPGYTLSENIMRAAGSGLGIPSSSILIGYPIKNAIDEYRRIPDEHKPHKIIQRKFKNAYYRIRGMERL